MWQLAYCIQQKSRKQGVKETDAVTPQPLAQPLEKESFSMNDIEVPESKPSRVKTSNNQGHDDQSPSDLR